MSDVKFYRVVISLLLLYFMFFNSGIDITINEVVYNFDMFSWFK